MGLDQKRTKHKAGQCSKAGTGTELDPTCTAVRGSLGATQPGASTVRLGASWGSGLGSVGAELGSAGAVSDPWEQCGLRGLPVSDTAGGAG